MKLEDFKKELLKKPEFKKEFQKFDLAFEIGQMLIEARIIKGVTQEKLAKMMGTKQSGIARAESGKYLPSLSFLQKIAKAFNTILLPPRFGFMNRVDIEVNYKSTNAKSKFEHKQLREKFGDYSYTGKSSSKNLFAHQEVW